MVKLSFPIQADDEKKICAVFSQGEGTRATMDVKEPIVEIQYESSFLFVYLSLLWCTFSYLHQPYFGLAFRFVQPVN